MSNKKNKRKQLLKLDPNKYRIYGIFNFKTDKLVYVNMDYEQTELELEIGDYSEDDFDLIEFDVILT